MEQTNRTMLFEQINPDKEDILTIIGETADRKSLYDDELEEIHKKLEVSSFEEFIRKFSPSVHMMLDTNIGNVQFSRGHIGKCEEKISIDSKDSLFQMLLYIMEARKNKKYVLTGFCDMLDNMIPKEDADRFLEERNQFIQYLVKHNGIATNRKKTQIKKAILQYDDGIFLLQTFLQNTHYILLSHNENCVSDKTIVNDEKMKVRVIKRAFKYQYTSACCESLDIYCYEQLIQECINIAEQHSPVKNTQLMKDCFMLPLWFQQKEYRIIQSKYQKYCKLYTDIIKKFWIEAKPLVETLLGIKEFFEQYENMEGMKPRLVIGNFSISALLTHGNREKLEAYLNTVNSKNYHRDTIWYAIVPNISNQRRQKKDTIRERFKGQRSSYEYYRNKAEEVSLLLELLGQYHIQSFISLENAQENTFSAFAEKGVEEVNHEFEVFEQVEGKDYMIPCFPNFVVIPQEQACMCIGKKLEYDELEEKLYIKDNNNVWLDTVGVEASYVAAGMVASCQCPKYLKKHFKNGVNEELPGVAYRFSQDNHNQVITSDMLSETIEFSREIVEEAMMKSRGIMFGQHNGKMIILTDRVFSFSRNNQLLLSMVQTVSYIERVIRYETQDYKKNMIIQFFQRKPGSIISKWYGNGEKCINNILKEDEELDYRIEPDDKHCIFEFHFRESDLVRSKIVSVFND